MSIYKLVSSNKNKLKEFQRFGLNQIELEIGRDLDEIDSTPLNVIIYKALEAGVNRIVEDTSLHIKGVDVGTNIRWLLNSVAEHKGKQAEWEVLLGLNNGEEIIVYQGLIQGKIADKYQSEPKGFGFDAYFIPNGTESTLYDLEQNNEKDNYSARKNAILQLQEKKYIYKVAINDIPKWNGAMQNKE